MSLPVFDENFMRFFWFGTVYKWDGYSDENTCYNIAMAQVSVAQEGKLPEMH